MEDKKKPGFRKWIILILVLFSPGIVLFTCSKHISSQGKQKMVELPIMGTLDDFVLKTEEGELITLESLKGQITILTTIQNSCPDTCGIQLSQANELIYESLYNSREKNKDVKILSIALDLEGHPVDNFYGVNFGLKKYIQNYDKNLWQVATGEADQFYDVVINGNNLYDELSEVSLGGKLFMSSMLLIDKKGQIRSMRLASGEAQVRDFSGEIRGLMGEYKHGKK